jgi:hypothetical protein
MLLIEPYRYNIETDVDAALRVNAPTVVGEVIDGEAVIMDLASGHYYSTLGSGAEIWSGIERGLTRDALVDTLAARYEADRDVIAGAVAVFIAELLEHRLIAEDTSPSAIEMPSAAPMAASRDAFVAPLLNTYADMEDLLLLDPIHDVDATGWPTANPKAAPPP